MCVLQGTLISPNRYGQATWSALPRRNSICGKQSDAEYTQRFRHLNRSKTQNINRNSLKNFSLYGFSKHPHRFRCSGKGEHHRFRCSGKGEHLNLASRQNPAVNPFTTSALQDFRQLCPRFRSQQGLECRRLHICPGGTSERGIPERCNRAAQASEPEQNPKNSLQLIEILSVARF